MIRIDFEMTEAEYREVLAMANPDWRNWYRPLTVAGWIAAGFGGAILLITGFRQWLTPALLIGIGLFVMCYPWLVFNHRSSTAWRDADVGQVVWEFCLDRIRCTSADSEVILNWGAFRRFSETKRMFVLYRGGGSATGIPKRAVGGLEQMRALRALLHEKLDRPSLGFPVVMRP
jgi:hypothetical protein